MNTRKIFCLVVAMCMVLAGNVGAWGDVAIDEEHFPDEIFREYVSSKFDIDSDDILSDTEIKRVTSLEIRSMGISSLQGIEHFTYLKYLYCDNNSLTSLNVSGNTALHSLFCYENQIKDLNVNTSLKYLYCHSNDLTFLDISRNTDLEKLSCENNNLTVLDVSYNTKLTYLVCFNNQLATLDTIRNTELQTLYCSRNHLTRLDLSRNTALEKLSCFGNQITSLNLSTNTNLSSLSCGSNQLTVLDLSNNQILTYKSIYGERITLPEAETNDSTEYPYKLNLNALKVSLDIETDTEDFISRVSSLDIRDSRRKSMEHSTDASAGIIYFASKPATIKYDYNTKLSGDTDYYMSVTVTFSADVSLSPEVVSITSANFPDDVFREYISSHFDKDNNGSLSQAEIEEALYISVYRKDITSLTGIEYFTSLVTLSCSDNHLTHLDLSNNTALKYPYISPQTVTIHAAEPTGDVIYPYKLNIANLAGDDIDVQDFVDHIHDSFDIDVRDANYERIESFDWGVDENDKPILRFASNPETIKYFYNTITSGDSILMEVNVTLAGEVVSDDTAVYIDANNFPDSGFRSYIFDFDTD